MNDYLLELGHYYRMFIEFAGHKYEIPEGQTEVTTHEGVRLYIEKHRDDKVKPFAEVPDGTLSQYVKYKPRLTFKDRIKIVT